MAAGKAAVNIGEIFLSIMVYMYDCVLAENWRRRAFMIRFFYGTVIRFFNACRTIYTDRYDFMQSVTEEGD